MRNNTQRSSSQLFLLSGEGDITNALVIVGFLLIVCLIGVIGYYTLTGSKEVIESFEGNERNLRAIATAAGEVISCSKQAEGDLMLYLTSHGELDKQKFPESVSALHEQILVLDQQVQDPGGGRILEGIKSNADEILSIGIALIDAHDKSIKRTGKFDLMRHQASIMNLRREQDVFSKRCVALAKLGVGRESDAQMRTKANVVGVQHNIIILVIGGMGAALLVGCMLSRMVNNLHKEIAERKRVEEALQESEERYRAIVEAFDGPIYICSQDYRVEFMNQKFIERAGRDATGERCYKVLHDRDTKCPQCVNERVFKGETVRWEAQSPKDKRWYYVVNTPICRPNGIVSKLGMIIDITDKKRAEQAVIESEQKFRELADLLPQSLFELDVDGNFTYGNRYGLETFGYSQEDMAKGVSALQVFAPEERQRVKENIRKVLTGEEFEDHEYIALRRDGSTLPVLIYSAPIIRENKAVGVRGIVLDISERKQMEDALREAHEELEKRVEERTAELSNANTRLRGEVAERQRTEGLLRDLNQQLSDESKQRKFLSKRLIAVLEQDRRRVSMDLHDHIGQTLTALKMDLEKISGQLKPDEESELKVLVEYAREKAIQAMEDIQNVARGLRPDILDTLGLVPSLIALFNEMKEHLDIEVHFFSQDVPKRFDREKALAIYRIAQEALTNVVKHASAKKVFVNLTKQDSAVKLGVEDDGVGFNLEKEMDLSNEKGALGLMIMRERTAQLDGEFAVESQIGRGTHLLAEIPV